MRIAAAACLGSKPVALLRLNFSLKAPQVAQGSGCSGDEFLGCTVERQDQWLLVSRDALVIDEVHQHQTTAFVDRVGWDFFSPIVIEV